MVFTTLAHHMDEAFLTEALHQLRKDAAAGIDEMTVAEYHQNLKENIADLHRRLVNRKYRAQPARRVWIPKSDGSQRPLAILVLEDKIVQRAVAMLLEAIYEPYFHTFSHGFRRGHSAHGALSYLRDQCLRLGINWIIDADIAKFFDTIEPLHLRTILQKRVNDGAILRLIGMWLHVGVLEEGKVVRSETGTPQGGVISPHPRSLCGLAEVVGPECAGTSPKSGAPVPPAMHVAVLAAPGARPCGPWLTIHSSILVTKVLCMRSRLQGLGKPVKKRYPRRSRRWRWGGVWGSAPVGSHGSR